MDLEIQIKGFKIFKGGRQGGAGTAGGWVLGAGKCQGIAIWVPALVLQLTTSWSGLRH